MRFRDAIFDVFETFRYQLEIAPVLGRPRFSWILSRLVPCGYNGKRTGAGAII